MRCHSNALLSGVVAFVLVAFTSPSTALGDTLDSATWTPGTGPPVTLVDGPTPVPITANSNGKVTLEATMTGAVEEVTVAFALQYEADEWYESGDAVYFTLRDEYITLTPQGPDTHVVAVIPVIHELYLAPDTTVPQTLYVWIGKPPAMVVDPVAGVSGASLDADYSVTTSIPSLTIIPPDESIVHGIQSARVLEAFVVRASDAPEDDVYTLSYAGDAGLLEALDLHDTVTIAAGVHTATIFMYYRPWRTPHFPGIDTNLSVTATSTFGSVTTSVKFAGEIACFWMEAEDEPEVVEPDGEYCERHTVVMSATKGTTTLCGPCAVSRRGGGPPPGGPAGKKGKSWVIPYKCGTPGFGCPITVKRFTSAEFKMSERFRRCKVKAKVKNKQTGAVEEKWVLGWQSCVDLVPTGGDRDIKAKDCD